MTFTLLSANLINFLCELGAHLRTLGRAGDGARRVGLVDLAIAGYMAWRCWRQSLGGAPSGYLILRLSGGRTGSACGTGGLGLPATGQIAFEGAVFGVVTVMAAKLDEVSWRRTGSRSR